MNILITGGAGYVGSHTAANLTSHGHKCIVFDNLSRGFQDSVKWGPLIIGDINDENTVLKALIEYKIDAVIHFAALAYVAESIQKPFKYWRNNVGGTLSLLSACKKASINRFIFSSTCAVYGQPKKSPINEDEISRPINPYGNSKLACEMLLSDYAQATGAKTVALRYFNAAGAAPDLGIGEMHNPETHLIPLAIKSFDEINKPLMIYGRDFDTPDGTAIRDYIHVNDLANAHRLALESTFDDSFIALNLGTGRGTSVQEVVTILKKLIGTDENILIRDKRLGDPSILIADASKAKHLLNWLPENNIEKILNDALTWYKQSHKIKSYRS